MAEQEAVNFKVVGSNPARGAMNMATLKVAIFMAYWHDFGQLQLQLQHGRRASDFNYDIQSEESVSKAPD